MANTNTILTPAMFQARGPYMLSLDNVTLLDLQGIITEWENYYLYKLLSNNLSAYPGGGIADLFIAECQANPIGGGTIAGAPTSARMVFIFNAFNVMIGDRMRSSKGMLRIFMAIIFYHYITEKASWSGTGGVSAGESSGSKTLTLPNTYRFAESRFNEALEWIEAIQWWLYSGNGVAAIGGGGGSAVYPEYLKVRDHQDETFKPKAQSIL